jgi:hypothetical protein
MAKLTKIPDVTETIVVKKGGFTLELSHEEADNLGKLIRGGVGSSTLTVLGLRGLVDALRLEGLGDEPREAWRKWSQTAQRTTL